MAILDTNRMAAVDAGWVFPPEGTISGLAEDLIDLPFLSRAELEAILGQVPAAGVPVPRTEPSPVTRPVARGAVRRRVLEAA